MLSMAECEVPVRPEELDTDAFALNFLNGTVDLRTGALKQHDGADLITKLIPHEYRPNAPCPQWMKFLDEIMGGGQHGDDRARRRAKEFVDYLQRALGYSITGYTGEKAVFLLFGDGNNGKSTLLTTIRQLVKAYSAVIQVESLMVDREGNNAQADLADLRGARFVQTSEAEEGHRLAQGKLKRISQGMGEIKAARKYENPITFPETHKLWIDTNRKPAIPNADDKATFARLHTIPFTVRIPAERVDKRLPTKLLGEAEGILAWLVEGARLWHESGLAKPTEVDAANEEWRADMDQLGRFIDDRCVVGGGYRVGASDLYAEYGRWAQIAGERPLSLKNFGLKLKGRGFNSKHISTGNRYVGVGLRPIEPVNGEGIEG